MDQQSLNDPKVILTVNDLEEIRSIAIKLCVDLNPKQLKLDEQQFRAYCYTMGVQAWLRSRGLLKIILD